MIRMITGTIASGKTRSIVQQLVLESRLHGKQSLLFTEDHIVHRTDLAEIINADRVAPNFLVVSCSLEDFLQTVTVGHINPVIPTSKTVRIGVDYSVVTPRVIKALHKLSALGYDVFVTCNVMEDY